jgi:hypothetical protein
MRGKQALEQGLTMDDPFETYRDAAGDATLAERMTRLRGEYPRTTANELDDSE